MSRISRIDDQLLYYIMSEEIYKFLTIHDYILMSSKAHTLLLWLVLILQYKSVGWCPNDKKSSQIDVKWPINDNLRQFGDVSGCLIFTMEKWSEKVLVKLKKLSNQGTSIVMLSHDEQCKKHADKVLCMKSGKIDEIM